MRVLYAIQGTGNGHLSRAREILPLLSAYADFDVLISGYNSDLVLPFPVKYKCRGISMAYDDAGRVSPFRTWKKLKSATFLKEVLGLPVKDYDLVINDFEPVSAYAALIRGVPSFAVSHQAAFLSPGSPRPAAKSRLGEGILRHFAPCTSARGFHFERYDRFIHGPVIRQEIREASISNHGHITVYLPAYSAENLLRTFAQLPERDWHIFVRGVTEPRQIGNCALLPVSEGAFLKSLATCESVLCGAGFELPSEALYLGKQLAVIPIAGQYEQQCNAEALHRMGVQVFEQLPNAEILRFFLQNELRKPVITPAETQEVLHSVFEEFMGIRKLQKADKTPNVQPA
jgi:uncharacterized protein (TIGR00661 family)